jgi:uncharacterized protein (DUF2141 family)
MKGIPFLFFLFLLVFWSGCANIGQPDGGIRDITPPLLDTALSTPGLQRNFHPDQDHEPIILKFNEWVKLEDAFKQVIISPPTQYPPEIVLKGKGVQIKMDPREILLPQTTYTINFGKAVKDLTEGNVVKDLRYVFSTGDIIDTGSINGKVQEALTRDTKEDLLVMLYYSDDDTIVYKRKPIYFTRTNKDGSFIIRNIKDTTYKIMVLEDANSNYLYDQDKENIGFFHRRVHTGEDSSVIQIAYYKSFIKPKVTGYSTDIPGLTKINSNVRLEELKVNALTDSLKLYTMLSKDTLMVYYLPATAKNWQLEVSIPSIIIDTIPINKFKKQSIDSFKTVDLVKGLQVLAPDEFKAIEFNHPVGMIDTSLISMIDDTSHEVVPLRLKSDSLPNTLFIHCPCQESRTYTTLLLPGSVKDYGSSANKDTIKLNFKGLSQDEGGSLVIEVSDLDSTKEYAISIVQDDKPRMTRIIHQVATAIVSYLHLIPGGYAIQIIEDINKNKKWDPGVYSTKTQPEKILVQKNYNVRANWELREQLKWKP